MQWRPVGQLHWRSDDVQPGYAAEVVSIKDKIYWVAFKGDEKIGNGKDQPHLLEAMKAACACVSTHLEANPPPVVSDPVIDATQNPSGNGDFGNSNPQLEQDFRKERGDGYEVCVEIWESERGWGSKIDEVRYYRYRDVAERFVREYNAYNNKSEVPDWYMYAKITN